LETAQQGLGTGFFRAGDMDYGAVIFDLDGTLLDTLQDLAGAMNRVLQRLGFPEHRPEAYKYFVGDGMVNLARRALPAAERRDEVVTRAAESLRAEYGRRWQEQTKPYPGIPELLQALQRQEIKLGVFTNKADDFAKLIIAAYFPEIAFGAVMGAQPPRPLKPDPAGALILSRELAVPPAATVFVGDSGNDMQTAAAAGMYAAGALWGFRTAAELRQSGAALLLEKPGDLLTLFNKGKRG
jgi:phosphoglycolate phosphatase